MLRLIFALGAPSTLQYVAVLSLDGAVDAKAGNLHPLLKGEPSNKPMDILHGYIHGIYPWNIYQGRRRLPLGRLNRGMEIHGTRRTQTARASENTYMCMST